MDTIKLKINLPIDATINAHGDIDIDYNADEALKAVQDAINRDADDIRFAILAAEEERAAMWKEEQAVERSLMNDWVSECLDRR